MTPRADKYQKKSKNFKKLEKNCKKYIFAISASGCRSVASHEGGGGGEVHGGRLGGNTGVGGGNTGVGGGNRAVGGGAIACGGSTVGCLQPLRTALHIISISLQNSLS